MLSLTMIEAPTVTMLLNHEALQVLLFTDTALVLVAAPLSRIDHGNHRLLHAPRLRPTLLMPLRSLDAVIEQIPLEAKVPPNWKLVCTGPYPEALIIGDLPSAMEASTVPNHVPNTLHLLRVMFVSRSRRKNSIRLISRNWTNTWRSVSERRHLLSTAFGRS